MSSDSGLAIEATNLGKCYSMFEQPSDRLKQLLWGRWRNYSHDFWALQGVSFEIPHGEVVGLVGRNGAGKSTLLQMVCGTLTPTVGSLKVNGRVAALLELGAGFSPDFSGLENVYMNAAILGLSRAEVDVRLDDILAFADIGAFIHQPVKTYSSGMFMRLAFAVATSVDPDILVIDEALSVGDGAFARKSFDRIMSLKDGGSTILFCTHAMYHVQALCSRAIWMEQGKMRMIGTAARVTTAYETALVVESAAGGSTATVALAATPTLSQDAESPPTQSPIAQAAKGTARLTDVVARADGVEGKELVIHSGMSGLWVKVSFMADPTLPCPAVGVSIVHANDHTVASVASFNDGVMLHQDESGAGYAEVVFDAVQLLRGDYRLDVYLSCERGLHSYEFVQGVVKLRVIQTGLEQGYYAIPHRWVSTR
jgi:lipopolysaccharide transport system ATP-binding protein